MDDAYTSVVTENAFLTFKADERRRNTPSRGNRMARKERESMARSGRLRNAGGAELSEGQSEHWASHELVLHLSHYGER